MLDIIINEIFFAILEGLFVFLVFSTAVINEKEKYLAQEKYKVFTFIILYSIFSFWVTLSLPYGYHTLILTLFTGIVLSVITKNNILVSIASVTIATISIIVIELSVSSLMKLVFKININDIINIPAIKIRFSIIAKIIELAFGFLVFKSSIKPIIKTSSTKDSINLLNYFILGVFLISIYFASLNYIIHNPTDLINYEILFFVILLVYILLGYFDVKNRIKFLVLQQKYTLQSEYIKNMETIISIIRREKHDFSNHLNTIYAMSLLNKPNTIENIKKYINKLSYSLRETSKNFNSGNDYIDGLLVVKNNYAFSNDINLDVEIEAPLNHLNIEDTDIISIISNIIDNSFDALTLTEKNDNKAVSLNTYIENDTYYISIANNGPKIPDDIKTKIFENGFSTKNDSDEHGLGLYIVNNIVRKYDGKIEVLSSDIETQFLISFPLKERYNGKNSRILDKTY